MVGSFDPSRYYGSTSGVVMVLPLDLFGIAIYSTIYELYGVEHPGKFYDSGLFRSCFMLQYAERNTRIGCLFWFYIWIDSFHCSNTFVMYYVLHMGMILSILQILGFKVQLGIGMRS